MAHLDVLHDDIRNKKSGDYEEDVDPFYHLGISPPGGFNAKSYGKRDTIWRIARYHLQS